jgi:hypothetical protein
MTWNPSPSHYIRAGVSAIRHKFTPSAVVLRDSDINLFEQEADILHSVESGAYVEDIIQIGSLWTINPGIRISHFYANEKTYLKFEPRFSSNLLIGEDLSWKASYATMNQYVHLLSSTGIGLPTDLWVPSTERIRPQNTWQVATGFAYDFWEDDIEVSLEGYYKKASDVIGYKEGASFLLIDDPTGAQNFSWQDNITHGEGWAYGLEFLVQRKTGKLSGWVGYTLSWTQQRFDDINFGEKFFARYDRRHDISVVAIYELNKNTTLSGTWVYASGNVFDIGTGRFPIITEQDSEVYHNQWGNVNPWWNSANVYDKKNSFRAASYQRLDLGVQFHKELVRFGADVKRTVELGVYNAYSRKNPFFYYWQEQYTPYYEDDAPPVQRRKLMQVSIFPLIPSISVNYSF